MGSLIAPPLSVSVDHDGLARGSITGGLIENTPALSGPHLSCLISQPLSPQHTDQF